MELKAQISAITSGAKEGELAEAEAGEGVGPQVTESHIADIVAQWTGIPIDKVPPSLQPIFKAPVPRQLKTFSVRVLLRL